MRAASVRIDRRPSPRRSRGAVAVVVAVSAVALTAMAGLAIDAGRLYVNKTELQSAADACALAAAAELVCNPAVGTCPSAYLQRATAAGTYVAALNKRDFQLNPVNVAAADVTFSTTFDSGYLPYSAGAGGASVNSKFARCTATSAGLLPWFMALLGAASSTVTASAVATVAPSGTNGVCPSVPMGACPRPGGGSYTAGDWIAANASGSGNSNASGGSGLVATLMGGPYPVGAIKGTFQWVDFDYPGGGTNEVSERLVGTGSTCGISTASPNVAEEGVKQGAKDAYNSRFGVYGNGANAYTYVTAPPDRTGYAYPTSGAGAIAVGTSAYADFRTRQASGTPFQGTGGGSNYNSNLVSQGNAQVGGNTTTGADHMTHGGNRRLVAMPLLNGCTGASNLVTIVGWGCFLLLNPMANGANADIFLEYVGDASVAGSPCPTVGIPSGGPSATGPLVPTLVQ
jgi:hypothetical protein